MQQVDYSGIALFAGRLSSCLFFLFIIIFFFNEASHAECPRRGDLTESVFDVFHGDNQDKRSGTAFLIDDANKLFLTAGHVATLQASGTENDKIIRLRDKKGREFIVEKIVLDGEVYGAAKRFKRLMGDWALLKVKDPNDDIDILPLSPRISQLTTQILLGSSVYQPRTASDASSVEWGDKVAPSDQDPKELSICSRNELRMLKISGFEKGYSGSPLLTRDCTVAALTASFSDGEEKDFFSDDEQKWLADKYRVLHDQLENNSGNTDSNKIIYKFVRDQQLVKFVPLACVIHDIVDARYSGNIDPFDRDSNIRTKIYLKRIIESNTKTDLNNTINGIVNGEFAWTELVEIENAYRHHLRNMSKENGYLLGQALLEKEKKAYLEYLHISFDLVSNEDASQPMHTSDRFQYSPSSAREIAEALISKANGTKITVDTLPQIIPEESESFGKGLLVEDKIKVAKNLEDYLTGRIPWPKKAKPAFKRLVADTALAHAASAYRDANNSKDQSSIADSLERIGTIINYGSKKKIMSDERYLQKANVGNAIFLNAERARLDSGAQ